MTAQNEKKSAYDFGSDIKPYELGRQKILKAAEQYLMFDTQKRARIFAGDLYVLQHSKDARDDFIQNMAVPALEMFRSSLLEGIAFLQNGGDIHSIVDVASLPYHDDIIDGDEYAGAHSALQDLRALFLAMDVNPVIDTIMQAVKQPKSFAQGVDEFNKPADVFRNIVEVNVATLRDFLLLRMKSTMEPTVPQPQDIEYGDGYTEPNGLTGLKYLYDKAMLDPNRILLRDGRKTPNAWPPLPLIDIASVEIDPEIEKLSIPNENPDFVNGFLETVGHYYVQLQQRHFEVMKGEGGYASHIGQSDYWQKDCARLAAESFSNIRSEIHDCLIGKQAYGCGDTYAEGEGAARLWVMQVVQALSPKRVVQQDQMLSRFFKKIQKTWADWTTDSNQNDLDINPAEISVPQTNAPKI